jgi:hypothetical protein
MGSNPWAEQQRGISSIYKGSRQVLGPTQLPIQALLGSVSLVTKRSGHIAALSSPRSVKFKSE